MDAFTVLGEPTRRSIVETVARRGALTAGEISSKFTVSAPAISQHLKVLRDAKILHVERRGRQKVYRVNREAIDEIDRWVAETKKVWEARLDRFGAALAPHPKTPKGSKGKH